MTATESANWKTTTALLQRERKSKMHLRNVTLLLLTLLVSACETTPSELVICEEAQRPIRNLASLEAEMTDAVALAADELLTVLDACP